MSDLSIRTPLIVGTLAIFWLVAGLGGWSVSTSLAGAIIAEGRVQVERNRQIVQHPDGGVVTDILVREGDHVTAGRILLRLDGAALNSDLAIVEGRLAELAAENARLVAERDGLTTPAFPPEVIARARHDTVIAAQIDGQVRLWAARRSALIDATSHLDRRIDLYRAQSAGIAAQIAAIRQQATLVAAELATQQRLAAKGLVAEGALLPLKRAISQLEGQLGDLAASRAQVLGLVTEAEMQIANLATRRTEEAGEQLRENAPVFIELTERKRTLQGRIARLDLRAPVDGLVLGLQVTTPRAVLRAADPALYVVPQDRALVISAKIAPANIESVRLNQAVEISVAALADHDAPRLTGKIAVISADALADTNGGLQYYRVEILLDPGQVERLAPRRLLPGMPVAVFVQTGAQTPMAYLLQPFAAYFSRALLET
ncbi:MAG: HlyD family type I secretion periplasmic adaptor subunit [Tabrizicola sp.]|uniref:HlyD family type I secretion periplasmic adaptor subunit n=1 Tax=Tabrizicola sp. TaxID=2005166 RepID=UPI0027328578|nr:HlyD family type I secretion periplasmic adaptor subunit [Tabrizicola sp.]MDP3262179.1 HlyD family type I secretion periplasmic adaptor subunit [Tabrizicola sp.]MDP3648075.1 HlyD family type I secretion periplasmic adaptor subunit [Paracoccaceae bacterium]